MQMPDAGQKSIILGCAMIVGIFAIMTLVESRNTSRINILLKERDELEHLVLTLQDDVRTLAVRAAKAEFLLQKKLE